MDEHRSVFGEREDGPNAALSELVDKLIGQGMPPDEVAAKIETIATLPGGWDLAHAIRLGIKPFAELGANSEALSGSHVDSPCSCRAIFESAPVAMLQSPISRGFRVPDSTRTSLTKQNDSISTSRAHRVKPDSASACSFAPRRKTSDAGPRLDIAS